MVRMTPTAAVRSILGDYVSEARCREVVVAVLRACREPSEGMLDGRARTILLNDRMGCDASGTKGPRDTKATVLANIHRAMIDALIEEVTAEAGR